MVRGAAQQRRPTATRGKGHGTPAGPACAQGTGACVVAANGRTGGGGGAPGAVLCAGPGRGPLGAGLRRPARPRGDAPASGGVLGRLTTNRRDPPPPRSDTVTVPAVLSWDMHETHGNKRAGPWSTPPPYGGGLEKGALSPPPPFPSKLFGSPAPLRPVARTSQVSLVPGPCNSALGACEVPHMPPGPLCALLQVSWPTGAAPNMAQKSLLTKHLKAYFAPTVVKGPPLSARCSSSCSQFGPHGAATRRYQPDHRVCVCARATHPLGCEDLRCVPLPGGGGGAPCAVRAVLKGPDFFLVEDRPYGPPQGTTNR